MKLMNFVIVLVILCGVIQICYGEILNCNFEDVAFSVETFYSCKVTSLDVTNNTTVLTGISGVHGPNKNDAFVKGIRIINTNTKYIPKNLGTLFNSYLTVLWMYRTQLVEIKSLDFNGMQELEELNLYDNKLTMVSINVLSTLTKLKRLDLDHNEIAEIPNGVFASNLQLENIILSKNKIKILGSTLFDGLTKLNIVYLGSNFCINKQYSDSTSIIQLKKDILMTCNLPNDIILSEINRIVESSFCSKQDQIETHLVNQDTKMNEQQSEHNQLKIILLEVVEQQRKNAIEMEKVNTKLTKVKQHFSDPQMQENKVVNLEGESGALNKDISATNNIRQSQQTIVIETKIIYLKANEQMSNHTKE